MYLGIKKLLLRTQVLISDFGYCFIDRMHTYLLATVSTLNA